MLFGVDKMLKTLFSELVEYRLFFNRHILYLLELELELMYVPEAHLSEASCIRC